MCGIVGALAFDGSAFEVTEAYIARMRDAMAHRGPDGAGLWVSGDRRVGLGHRRLAIIDLSAAAGQPMSTTDGSMWIVFNGEIYNHAELREELESEVRGQRSEVKGQRSEVRGQTLNSQLSTLNLESRSLFRPAWTTDHSDTEVVLQAFRRWGIDGVHRFRGMFAFAVWDAHRRELWLVRDRLGVKPLYFTVHHGRLVFASEIKALLKDPQQKREVDEEALFHYLSFLTTPAPGTLFEGICKLPPGTWIRATADGGLRAQRYWDVWDDVETLPGDEDEIAGRLLDSLRTAVAYRKVSDVPVGVFLSGGIDSSTNAALFSETGEQRSRESGVRCQASGVSQGLAVSRDHAPLTAHHSPLTTPCHPLKTFTITYDDDCRSNPSEAPFARRVARRFGAVHHEHRLRPRDLLDFLPQMIELQDEPIADPVCVPVYYVSRLAREHGVIVCQVGEGADELFGGYPGWQRMLRLQRLLGGLPGNVLTSPALAALRLAGRGDGWPAEKLSRAAARRPVFWGGAEAFTERQKLRLLTPGLLRRVACRSSWKVIEPIWRRFREKADDASTLNWMSYLDINFRLPELLLMRVDKMSMGVGLEARVPFLDHEFVAAAMSVPPGLKIRGGQLKHILKRAVRGVIPDEIIDRPKQGFGVPLSEWLLGGLGETIETTLADFCRRTDYFNREEVLRLAAVRHPASWYLLNFALWWKRFIADEEVNLASPLRSRAA